MVERLPIRLPTLPPIELPKLPKLPIKLPEVEEYIPEIEERLPPEMLVMTLLDDVNRRMASIGESLQTIAKFSVPPLSKQETMENLQLTDTYRIAQLRGIGSLDEAIVALSSSNFYLTWSWDAEARVRMTFDELAQYSAEWLQLSAYRRYDFEGNPQDYVVRLANVNFREKFDLLLIPRGPLTLNKLILKYSLRD